MNSDKNIDVDKIVNFCQANGFKQEHSIYIKRGKNQLKPFNGYYNCITVLFPLEGYEDAYGKPSGGSVKCEVIPLP